MALQPKISGETIERAFEEYRNGKFLVNRRYQRKLVWSLEEKQEFIDSIIHGYPVPSFLFAVSPYKNENRQEIIDGMQRLNAVFSFIENEYSTIDGCYFDLSATAITKELLDNSLLKQKEPVLERKSCVDFSSYELPFSIYEEKNSDIIDEVFRRINANGKHLSRQEIRQAGATGDFAQLVRTLATQLRGDVSHDDILLLSSMKEISIQQDAEYGINADDVFWVKQNIIDKKDLRLSVDEEIVADLVGAMLSDPIPPSRVSVLDGYYDVNDSDLESRGTKIEKTLQTIGVEKVSSHFLYIIDEIKKIFNNRNDSIIQHILAQRKYRGPRYFQALFLTLYDLLIKKEKKIIDYDAMYDKLYNIAEKTMIISGGGGAWSAKEKAELIAKVGAILDQCVVERTEGDPMLYSYTTEIETLLRQSQTENSQYDFKQGIHDIQSGDKNNNLIKKIFKTLTCMGNSEKNAVGYVLIGVADKFDDALKISNKYGTSYSKVGNFYITGIDGEVNQYYNGDYDKYFLMFKQELKNMPMSDYYIRQIGAKMRMVNYDDKSIIILKIVSDNGAVVFDNSYYTRIGANNEPEPITATEMQDFFAKFLV